MGGFLSKKFSFTENRKKIFGNVSWAVVGKTVDVLRALLIGILVARFLKPHNYGLLNYTIGYVGMFSLLVEFGMTGILVRELAKQKTDKNELLGSASIIRIVMAVFTIFIVIGSALLFEGDKMLKLFIIINSFNLIFLAFSETLRAFFRSQLKNEYIVKSQIFKTVVLIVVKLLLLAFKAPLLYFVIASSVDALIILLSFQYFFRKKYWGLRKFTFSKTAAKGLIWSSFPLFFEGIAAVLYQRIDVVMAGKFIDPESVGYYSVAIKFVSFAIFIPLVIAQTLSPLLVQKFEKSGNDLANKDYQEYKQKVADFIILSGVTVSLGLFFLAKPVILILYGQEYSHSVDILRILAWKGLFCGLGYAGSALIIAEGRQKYVYLRNIIGGILNLFLNFLLIPRYGINGVAFATIVSFGVATYVSNLFIPMYRVDFMAQSNSLLNGWGRMLKYFKELRLKK